MMCKKTIKLYKNLILEKMKKILVIKHGALGDIVLSMHPRFLLKKI